MLGFEDIISIASLYLALVGLLSTFFFVHLGQWLNGILGTEAKWLQVKGREPSNQFFDKKLECYFEANQSNSVWTFWGWLAVTFFMATVTVFSEILRSRTSPEEAFIMLNFISIPTYIFLAIYFVLSVLMLRIGYSKANKISNESAQEL